MKRELDSLYESREFGGHIDEATEDLDGPVSEFKSALHGDALTEYLDAAEYRAKAVLDDAGIDAGSLFEIVETRVEGPHGEKIERCMKFAQIDRLSSPVGAQRALDILWHLRTLRDALARGDAGAAAMESIRLTQHVERLNVDQAFLKPVSARVKSEANIRARNKPAVTDEQIIRVVKDPQYRYQKQQAAALGIGVRALQKRLKKIETK